MDNLIFTIFGATGDLTFRKLVPALFFLYKNNYLNNNFKIIGFSRREYTDKDFSDYLNTHITIQENELDIWKEFLQKIIYIPSEFEDIRGYNALNNKILEIEKEFKTNCTKIFYYAMSPQYYLSVSQNILNSLLKDTCKLDNAKIVIEKPYGTDKKNAEDVNTILSEAFLDKNIYRIDHYLGKETVQNILVFRASNSIFDRLWSKDNIEFIQIKMDENIGVEDRGGYYDVTGAFKDMIPNHGLQILSLITMDLPKSFNYAQIQNEKYKIIDKVDLYDNSSKDIIRGQYESYKNEKNVLVGSDTETFISTKLRINNDKWKGVPIYIRTGKKMKNKLIEVSIKFKSSNNLFGDEYKNQKDILSFRIQPDEGISLLMLVKEPSDKIVVSPVTLDFCYKPTFGKPMLDSYIGLINDTINSNQSSFISFEEVLGEWSFYEKIKSFIKNSKLEIYPDNSDGPKSSEDLLLNEGYIWINNEKYTCALRY